MYDDILVPTDVGEEMERVLDHALAVADPHDATVHVVSVVDRRAFLTLDDELIDDVERQLERESERAVGEAADRVEAAGLAVEATVRQGDPAEEILAYAESAGADLIVMGTRRRAANQTALGSVSQSVTNRSAVPVLVVDIARE